MKESQDNKANTPNKRILKNCLCVERWVERYENHLGHCIQNVTKYQLGSKNTDRRILI